MTSKIRVQSVIDIRLHKEGGRQGRAKEKRTQVPYIYYSMWIDRPGRSRGIRLWKHDEPEI